MSGCGWFTLAQDKVPVRAVAITIRGGAHANDHLLNCQFRKRNPDQYSKTYFNVECAAL
jgi:hypothetical protein